MRHACARLVPLAALLATSLVLTACGSSGGTMSDEDKIKTMQKAHDVPLGPGSGGAPGATAPGAAGAPPAATGG